METGPHPNPSQALASAKDIERLLASPLAIWRLEAPVQLAFLQPTPDLRLRLEARLNSLASVCGCAEASLAGAVALLFLVVTWVQSGERLGWTSGLTILGAVIATSLIAKTVRVAAARLQMRRLLREISDNAPIILPSMTSGSQP